MRRDLRIFTAGLRIFMVGFNQPDPRCQGRLHLCQALLYGALVLQLPEEYHPGGQWCRELPTEQLATGVYLCVVSVERRQYRQRVLVIR